MWNKNIVKFLNHFLASRFYHNHLGYSRKLLIGKVTTAYNARRLKQFLSNLCLCELNRIFQVIEEHLESFYPMCAARMLQIGSKPLVSLGPTYLVFHTLKIKWLIIERAVCLNGSNFG